MTRRRGVGAAALAVGVAAAYAPVVASVGPLRRALLPSYAGQRAIEHLALTFDDGPDAASTPHVLELLAEYDVRATFFLLGEHVGSHAGLVREMAAAGHELAVHGWDHRCVVRTSRRRLSDELGRTRGLVQDLTGQPVDRYRPPYGVTTTASLLAARDRGLRPVLWTAWGRDWERRATPARIVGSVNRTATPGGTVLLHDSDRTSAPGSWIGTLAACETLLQQWAAAGTPVGPLRDHVEDVVW